MQYHAPFDQQALNPNASYVNGNPGTGTQGSIPDAGTLEFPQREIVAAIAAAGLTPADTDLSQLLRAIRGGQLFTFTDQSTSANAITIAPGVAHTAIAKGLPFRIFPAYTNTAPVVAVHVNNLSAPLKRHDGSALVAGDIVAGVPFDCVSDGTNFLVLGYVASDIPSVIINTPGFYRIRATSNLNFYISPTGSDGNNGLTAGTPWLTRSHAYSYVQTLYDLAGYTVTVNMAAGNYSDSLNAALPIIGGSAGVASVVFQGAGSGSTIISCPTNSAFLAQAGALYTVAGMTVSGGGSGASQGCGLYAASGAIIDAGTDVKFASSLAAHMYGNGGFITTNGSAFTIAGSAASALLARFNGEVSIIGSPVTLIGTPGFASGFAAWTTGGQIEASGATYSGSVTGPRYVGTGSGQCNTSGAGTTAMPGSAAGSVSGSAVYT